MRKSLKSFVPVLALCTLIMIINVNPSSAQDLPRLRWILGTAEPSHQDWSIKPLDVMAENIAKRTGDKFTMKVTIGGELGINREEIPMALQTGKIQMAYLPGGHITGSIPHLGIFGLPFMIGSVKGINPDAMAMYEATEAMTVREFKKLNIAPSVFFISTPAELISKKKIDDMGDLKGLKVRTWDEATSSIVKSLNGVPVVMAATETYLALQRGVVDAVITGAPAMLTMSLNEQAPYLYMVNLAPPCIFIATSMKIYDDLPKDYKNILQDEFKILRNTLFEAQKSALDDALSGLRAKKTEIIEIKPDVMERVKAKVKPLWGEWAKKGPTNQEAYDAVAKALNLPK